MTSSDKKQRKMLKTQYMALSVYSDSNLKLHRQTEQNQIDTQKTCGKNCFIYSSLPDSLYTHTCLTVWAKNSMIKNSTASRHGKF